MGNIESVPIVELNEVSFARFPVWKFGLESEGEADESQVTPAEADFQLGTHGSFVVKATYRLRDGRELPGAVQVDILNRKVISTPVFLYVNGRHIDPLAADAEIRIARITKFENSRPTHWVLGVTISGETRPRSGRIEKIRLLQAFGLMVRLFTLKFSKSRAR